MKDTPAKYQPGDRVAERPKVSRFCHVSPETEERIAQYRSQRYGTVVDTYIKVLSGRSRSRVRSKYVRVLWDGLQTPSDHSQSRICLESELPELLEKYAGALG